MNKFHSQYVKNPSQAVQVIHALRDLSDEQEKVILMPEIRMIVKSLTTRSIDGLVPATNRMLRAYFNKHGDLNGAITEKLSII